MVTMTPMQCREFRATWIYAAARAFGRVLGDADREQRAELQQAFQDARAAHDAAVIAEAMDRR